MPDGSPYLDAEGISPVEGGAKQLVPARYNEMTELTASVPAGGTTLNFELTTEP